MISPKYVPIFLTLFITQFMPTLKKTSIPLLFKIQRVHASTFGNFRVAKHFTFYFILTIDEKLVTIPSENK